MVASSELGIDYKRLPADRERASSIIRLISPSSTCAATARVEPSSRLIKKQAQEADRSGPIRPIRIDHIGDDGAVVIDGRPGSPASRCRSGSIIWTRSWRSNASQSLLHRITHVSFRGRSPARAELAFGRHVSVRDGAVFSQAGAAHRGTSISVDGVQHYLSAPAVNLQISSDKFSLPEIARIVPALAGVRLQPAFEVKVGGVPDRLNVEMNVRSSAGQITGSVIADLMTPGQWSRGLSRSASQSGSDFERSQTEERHHRRRARRRARGVVRRSQFLAGTVSLTAPRLCSASTPQSS